MRQDTLTYEQASRYCGKPIDTLRKLVSRGFLHAEKQQGHREKLLSKQEVERFFNMPVSTQQNPPVNDPDDIDVAENTTQALFTRMDNLASSIERLAVSIENALIEEIEPDEEQVSGKPAQVVSGKASATVPPANNAPAQTQPAKKPAQVGTTPQIDVNTPEPQYRFVRRNGRKVKRLINQ